MARLVLGVLGLGFLWWGWSTFSSGPNGPEDVGGGQRANGATPEQDRPVQVFKPVPPGDPQPANADKSKTAEPKSDEPRRSDAGHAAAKPGGAAPSRQGRPQPVPPRAGQARSGVPLTASFSNFQPGGAQGKVVAEKLLVRAHRARTFDGLMKVLGQDNSFLHSVEGRKAAELGLARALKSQKAVAVQQLSRLLELCMRGPIRPEDQAAKDLVNRIYARHKPLVRRVIFDPERVEGAQTHKVRPGESLDRIAAHYRAKSRLKLEANTLAMVNRIHNPNLVQAGQMLKIPVQPFRAVVEKRSFLMAIYLGDQIIRLYWIGHGKEDCTPEATFTVGIKKKNPDWYSPDGNVYAYGNPKNVLGDYFVGFKHRSFRGFGAHGTPEPGSIGRTESRGCIRMLDADIKEFFKVMPRGCEVVIKGS